MENADKSDNTNPPIQQPRWYRRLWFTRYVERKFQERKAKKEKESPTDRAARITTKATVWIAAFTVVMALVGAGTLYEIIEGGSDTHDLAVAAKAQAEKMGNMSDAAEKIRQAAEGIVTQEQRIADNAQKSLDASNRQSKAALDAATSQFRAENRPWISLQNVRPTDGRNIPDPDVPNNWYVTYDVVNTGHSPATRVEIRGFITISKNVNSTFRRDAPCGESDARSDDPTFPSLTVFASQPAVNREYVFSFREGDTPTFVLGGDALVVCISYRDGSTHELHHTKMLFNATEGEFYTDRTGRRIQRVDRFEFEDAETD
jgi:hypothetical protein